jgi:hypothetical protein
MNRLHLLVYVIVAICLLGTLFTGGQAQQWFENLLISAVAFILVVELVPQFIVADEKESVQKVQ